MILALVWLMFGFLDWTRFMLHDPWNIHWIDFAVVLPLYLIAGPLPLIRRII